MTIEELTLRVRELEGEIRHLNNWNRRVGDELIKRIMVLENRAGIGDDTTKWAGTGGEIDAHK